MDLGKLLDVPAPALELQATLQGLIDGKAKPLGALGRMEELALQIGIIQGTTTPHADRPMLLIFAGDHGMTRAGVMSFPSGNTVSMVDNLLQGQATANAFARVVGAELFVVDAGTDADLTNRAGLVHAKVARGTGDATVEPAMTSAQAEGAIVCGAGIATDLIVQGADLVILGEVGCGNTASASLITHSLTNAPLHMCIGPGAGHSPESMGVKRMAIQKAAQRSDAQDPLEVLHQFGGFEIAMMAGAILACGHKGVPVLIDGFICAAAALVAIRMSPHVAEYCIFTHSSPEPGSQVIMTALKARPLLNLNLHLGEGTGALLAIPLVQAACAFLCEVTSRDETMPRAAGF